MIKMLTGGDESSQFVIPKPLAEHGQIVSAIEAGDGDAADKALRDHISKAYVTRLKLDAEATP